MYLTSLVLSPKAHSPPPSIAADPLISTRLPSHLVSTHSRPPLHDYRSRCLLPINHLLIAASLSTCCPFGSLHDPRVFLSSWTQDGSIVDITSLDPKAHSPHPLSQRALSYPLDRPPILFPLSLHYTIIARVASSPSAGFRHRRQRPSTSSLSTCSSQRPSLPAVLSDPFTTLAPVG